MIASGELYRARLGARDDTVVRCGGSENRCRDQLAYIDTLPNGVRWLFFDARWHVDYPDDALLFDWLRAADPLFAHLQNTVAVWRWSKQVQNQCPFRRPSPAQPLPNGGPQAGAFRRAGRLPALAVCWYGHINVLDAALLRVK